MPVLAFEGAQGTRPSVSVFFNDFYDNYKTEAHHNGQIPYRSLPSPASERTIRGTSFYCQRTRQRVNRPRDAFPL